MSLITWKPKIKKWYNVDKDAYALIFSQAKERFEDVLAESESITNKSIKMLTTLGALFGFLIGFLLQKKASIGYFAVYSIFFLIEVIFLVLLIIPKEIKNRGLSPEKSIPVNLDDSEDKGYQVELIYYQSIIVLQDNIDFMIKKNTDRAFLYKWALLILILILTAVATLAMVLL